MMLFYLCACLVSFAITWFLIPKLLLISVRKRILDISNERKVHTRASSRLGGVAFFPSIIIPMCLGLPIYFMETAHILAGESIMKYIYCTCACFIVYLTGMADDIVSLRYRIKFILQIIASLLIVASGVYINNLYGFLGIYAVPAWFGIPLSIFLIVFITNSINLIDGIDGLASGLSIIALLVYGVLFASVDSVIPATLAFTTAGTLIAFCRYNLRGTNDKRTRIFMGDAGALLIGTILSILAINMISQAGVYPTNNSSVFLAAYSVLIIPCFDVARVVIHRFRKRRPLFYPDKNNFHHKLIALGLSQRQTLAVILTLSLFFIAMNFLLDKFIPITAIVGINIFIWSLLHIILTKKIRTNKKTNIQ